MYFPLGFKGLICTAPVSNYIEAALVWNLCLFFNRLTLKSFPVLEFVKLNVLLRRFCENSAVCLFVYSF
jgi:hypothetical protein